jgi:molybdopterin synthase sulfur carrier subunit
MASPQDIPAPVVVRYWAGARAAAGVAEERFDVTGSVRLAELLASVLERHGTAAGLDRVLAVCSVLVDGTPVSSGDAAEVEVPPGAEVEFLPPFAGG